MTIKSFDEEVSGIVGGIGCLFAVLAGVFVFIAVIFGASLGVANFILTIDNNNFSYAGPTVKQQLLNPERERHLISRVESLLGFSQGPPLASESESSYKPKSSANNLYDLYVQPKLDARIVAQAELARIRSTSSSSIVIDSDFEQESQNRPPPPPSAVPEL